MSPQMRAWHHAFNHDIALGPALAPRLAGLSGWAVFYPTGVELHSPVWMCGILSHLPWDLTKPALNQLRFYGGTPSERDNHHFHLHPGISIFSCPQQHCFCTGCNMQNADLSLQGAKGMRAKAFHLFPVLFVLSSKSIHASWHVEICGVWWTNSNDRVIWGLKPRQHLCWGLFAYESLHFWWLKAPP